jgi:hypothetical protein
MIFIKSTLAGVAAVITAALVIYGLAVGVPRILELISGREGGTGATASALFQCGRLGAWRFLSFLVASSGAFGEPCAIAKKVQTWQVLHHRETARK